MKTALTLVVLVFLSGCGTINTTFRGDQVAASHLGSAGTYCNSIPRLYSGIGYDFCLLNARRRNQTFFSAPGMEMLFFDAVLSAALDTLVLPYTLVKQYEHGNIPLNRL
ncbi:MAG TPA: YceK/YidQ family lipoprotein [Cellvibrionaceae bacterium]